MDEKNAYELVFNMDVVSTETPPDFDINAKLSVWAVENEISQDYNTLNTIGHGKAQSTVTHIFNNSSIWSDDKSLDGVNKFLIFLHISN